MARILTITLNPALDLTVRMARLEVGEVNRSAALLSHAAGKGLNVAQVLSDLGHQLVVTGFLGQDNLPPFEALIHQRGFVDGFVRVPGETRSNIKLAEADGRVTDINGPGPWVDEAAQQTLLDNLEHLASGCEVAVVAGSLPQGIAPQWLQTLLLQLEGLGLKVALDTSGAALRAGLAAGPWLVKPNDEELADVYGQPVESAAARKAAASWLHSLGVEHVVISQGAAGVSWFSPAAGLQAVPPKVSVASTVGAGDSLLAGMLHGLISGHGPEQTLATATAIAAMAVTQIGFGVADPVQLAELERGVQVRALTEQ